MTCKWQFNILNCLYKYIKFVNIDNHRGKSEPLYSGNILKLISIAAQEDNSKKEEGRMRKGKTSSRLL